MGYLVECFCWIIAVNAAHISTVEDWVLQKTPKEENGEMKYLTREKKLLNDLSSGLPQICDKKFINIIKDIVT